MTWRSKVSLRMAPPMGICLRQATPSVSQHAIHDKFAMHRVAEFLRRLDAVQESKGTLLDNTVFLYGNVEARGFHEFNDLPVIVAGGQGKLKTGYYMDYRPRPFNVFDSGRNTIGGRPYNNLLITL
jgi:hypothetical protein